MSQNLLIGIFGCVLATWLAGCTGPNNLATRASSMRIDGNTYIVQAGDTIEAVAFRYQTTAAELARLNPGLSNALYAGQPIQIRSGDRQEISKVARSHAPRRHLPVQTEVPASYRPTNSEHVTTHKPHQRVVVSSVPVREVPIRESNPVAQETRKLREEIIQDNMIAAPSPSGIELPSTVSSDGWIWPMHGEIVRGYAPEKVHGQGIDIAGLPGQDIHAAAGGVVIYAGRDLSDSGNLVIVRHSDEVLTTYSNARNIFVNENQTVNAGTALASLGASSSGESVLRFGVRKSGKPVDPMEYLPNR